MNNYNIIEKNVNIFFDIFIAQNPVIRTS